MTARYFKETPCEHGEMSFHIRKESWTYPFWCPGGVRQEVTIDYEAAAMELAEAVAMAPSFHTMSPQQQEDYAAAVKSIVFAALVVEPVDP